MTAQVLSTSNIFKAERKNGIELSRHCAQHIKITTLKVTRDRLNARSLGAAKLIRTAVMNNEVVVLPRIS
jgi:hypothetical protein